MDEERQIPPEKGREEGPTGPGDISRQEDPHHSLNAPAGDPDPTEWPDPYDKRQDPRDPEDPDGEPFGEEPHPQVGSRSTSEPHPSADPEAAPSDPPERENLDE
jgi:hypothetical protein